MKNSKIEWTDHTFNPWIGCTKVSDGCKHCYAETLMDKRYGKVQWGPQGTRVRTSDAYWRKPLTWNRQAAAEGRRYKVFCASLADVFEDRAELAPWRRDLFQLIEKTPHLDWLLLTKRPESVQAMIAQATGRYPEAWLLDHRNVWIGTSVENQETADERIPQLLNIPWARRFLSMEPLLGPVDLHKGCDVPDDVAVPYIAVDWVIVGGESGHCARPMSPDWARGIRDQCQAAGVPFFFKQWGEWLPGGQGGDMKFQAMPGEAMRPWIANGDSTQFYKIGKHAAGRLLDGREWDEFPQAVTP